MKNLKLLDLLKVMVLKKDVLSGNVLLKMEKNFQLDQKEHINQKRIIQRRKKIYWQKLTVVFQEYTPDGIPRFPVGKTIRNKT